MEIKEKTNEKVPEKVVNKTTETLIKELETLSDKSLYDLFCFFYKLNHTYGQMIDNEIIINKCSEGYYLNNNSGFALLKH